jgi:hypothetical protein
MSSEKDGQQANEGNNFPGSFISTLIMLYCLISKDFDRNQERFPSPNHGEKRQWQSKMNYRIIQA